MWGGRSNSSFNHFPTLKSKREGGKVGKEKGVSVKEERGC